MCINWSTRNLGTVHLTHIITKTSARVFESIQKTLQAGEFKKLEGVWNFKRNVIIKFPSYEKALEWYNSDEYNQIKNLRLKNTEGNLIIIKGV